MAQSRILAAAVGLIGLLTTAGACLPSSSSSGPAGSPVQVSPQTEMSPGGPSGSPNGGEPVDTVPGVVTVTLVSPTFLEGEVIRGTVANGLDKTIYTQDSKSNCSIVLLEQWNGTSWVPVHGCKLGRAPAVVPIHTGRGLQISLDPNSTHLTSEPGVSVVQPGRYRLIFSFGLMAAGQFEETMTVHSDPFSVR
jgi:hypothetical protein